LGKLPLEAAAVETAMQKAAQEAQNVICHEFYVTGSGDWFVVFLQEL
jgi:hypothetical protein